MRTKKLAMAIGVVALAILGMLSSTGSALAAQPAAVTRAAVTTDYTITYTCTSGCTSSFVHEYVFNLDCSGNFTGTGFSVLDQSLSETVTGTVSFDRTTFTLRFDYTSVYTSNPSYTVAATGTVDPRSGALTGTAAASGQTFMVSGVRTLFTVDRSPCDREGEDRGE